jgi:sugar phosphate isomerase/epimerase
VIRSQVSRREFLQDVSLLGTAGVLSLAHSACASGTSRWQIGCYTRPWADHEYTVALDAIAEAGYRYVGLMTTKRPQRLVVRAQTTPEEAQKIAEEIQKRGLEVPSIWGGGLPVQESVEAGVQALRRIIDNCEIVGGANVLMGGVSKPELHEPYYQAISECCDYAAEKSIGISLKPHGGSNATGPQCRKTLENVNHPNFRLWYDPGNIFFYSRGALDPVEDSRTVNGLVVGMSVKDYRPPREVAITPGTGQVDFPNVLANLKQGGFTQGPLIVETLNRGDLPATLEEAKKARRFVEELVAGLE